MGPMLPLVLIVDDERDLARLVDFNLRQAGLETSLAHNADEALTALQQRPPDLVLLDLMLPDMSGTELCRRIKAQPKTAQVPVIMLTAKSEEPDRVTGFEAGADDYVVKPFSVRELVLRVKAVLRRAQAPEPSGPVAPQVELGPIRLDLGSHRCFISGSEVALTVLEFKLLHHLMTRVGRVQTRDQLLADVWGVTSPLETRTIDTHVMRLREKLGPARQLLETVRGVGYRMVEQNEARRGEAPGPKAVDEL